MRLQVLGSGGYYPNERRQTACYFLPESAALLDAGTGTSRLLDRIQADQLDVFLSHAHLDHICGLTYLLVPMFQQRLKQVRLFGTVSTLEAVQTHLFSVPIFPVMPDFTFCPLNEHPHVELADGSVLTHRPLRGHPGGSTAFRIDWPERDNQPSRSVAYVTDTTVDGTYTDFIHRVDLLLHECYFPDDEAEWADQTGHSHTTPVAELAAASAVGRLLLIHMDPQKPADDPIGLDAARALFPMCEIAEDLAEISLAE